MVQSERVDTYETVQFYKLAEVKFRKVRDKI